MNFYFFLEGRRTEPKVYRSWLFYAFPELTEVKRVWDVKNNHYFIRSGMGYPEGLYRLDEVAKDVEQHGAIDELFICFDGDEDADKRFVIIEKRLAGKISKTNCHIIIANCCIETWLLGNRRMMPSEPTGDLLKEFKAFYDVSLNCPETMGFLHTHGRTNGQFHKRYLRELLRENGHSYSETNPSAVKQLEYLDNLTQRYDQTGHIQSFGRLVLLWRSLGGNI